MKSKPKINVCVCELVRTFLFHHLFILNVFISVPIDSFTAIDRYFAAFVCATYLLFTAILSINIFIGLISNALQTEAFSTVEARFLLERVEVILSYEWRFSKRKRSQIQEIIHRFCSPLQLNWKDINFDAHGQSREQQQAKALTTFRQTLEKQNTQFDHFRVQFQQKLSDIDGTLSKIHQTSKQTPPDIVLQKSGHSTPVPSRRTSLHPDAVVPPPTNQNEILGELSRLREFFEETFLNQLDRNATGTSGRAARPSLGSISSESTTPRPSTTISPTRHALKSEIPRPIPTTTTMMMQLDSQTHQYSQDLNERVTDLQLAVNRLHQDVSAIRQVVERMSPLSASLILGRTAGKK